MDEYDDDGGDEDMGRQIVEKSLVGRSIAMWWR